MNSVASFVGTIYRNNEIKYTEITKKQERKRQNYCREITLSKLIYILN